jgi:uncharacterized coiled-coil protein SlyX
MTRNLTTRKTPASLTWRAVVLLISGALAAGSASAADESAQISAQQQQIDALQQQLLNIQAQMKQLAEQNQTLTRRLQYDEHRAESAQSGTTQPSTATPGSANAPGTAASGLAPPGGLTPSGNLSPPVAADVTPGSVLPPTAVSPFSNVKLWGYGELYYTHPTREGNKTEADLARAVFGIGYTFDEKTEFNSEFEVEHAVSSASDVGEFEVEQFYVDRQLNDYATCGPACFSCPSA